MTQDHICNIDTISLDKIRFAVQQSFPGVYFQDMEIETHVEVLTHNIITRLNFILYGKQYPEKVLSTVLKRITIPTSWWQMFKRDYAPAWFLARFPVKSMKENVIERNVYRVTKVCPHLNVKSIGTHLEFFTEKGLYNDLFPLP
jgi:hypothetical protein